MVKTAPRTLREIKLGEPLAKAFHPINKTSADVVVLNLD